MGSLKSCKTMEAQREGVLVAWGFTEAGERVLLAVMLGMRESHDDRLALGRDLIARGLGAPLLIAADGAPGPIKAIEQQRGNASAVSPGGAWTRRRLSDMTAT